MNESNVGKQLDLFLKLAQEKGYLIRKALLGGIGSSLCEIRGKPCLFLDVSCGPAEQLESIKISLALAEESSNTETSSLT